MNIIFTSSDGEENLDDISYFKKYFSEGADLVIGSRLKDGGKFKSDSELKDSQKALKFITYLINTSLMEN